MTQYYERKADRVLTKANWAKTLVPLYFRFQLAHDTPLVRAQALRD